MTTPAQDQRPGFGPGSTNRPLSTYLGAQVAGRTACNHAADAVFDEAVLQTGAALHLLAADGLPAA